MLDAFRLIPALQVIFTQEMEFTEDRFAALTTAQSEALARRGERFTEPVYRVTTIEPQAIERSAEKVLPVQNPLREHSLFFKYQKWLLQQDLAISSPFRSLHR